MSNSASPYIEPIDPALCLGGDETVQTAHPAIIALATDLRAGCETDEEFAARAFAWVRDEVGHSYDVQDPRVTLTASEVLEHRVGLCYAKAHLLAALLRSQGVPTALCYQLLGDDGDLVVHGLVAIHLQGGWHRQDPRGNKEGVDAQFSLDDEQLAWPVDPALGEIDYPDLFVAPAVPVVDALRSTDNILDLYDSGLPTALEPAMPIDPNS